MIEDTEQTGALRIGVTSVGDLVLTISDVGLSIVLTVDEVIYLMRMITLDCLPIAIKIKESPGGFIAPGGEA